MYISNLNLAFNRQLSSEIFELKYNKSKQDILIEKIGIFNIDQKNKFKSICTNLVKYIDKYYKNVNEYNIREDFLNKELIKQLSSIYQDFTKDDISLIIALCTHRHNSLFTSTLKYPATLKNLFKKVGINIYKNDLNILNNKFEFNSI
ncbi:MAG TPA: hypothetical protein PKD00_06060 [Burkholderiales bacterium]|nr:hypothetical protein [Burkholderiales bacterium]